VAQTGNQTKRILLVEDEKNTRDLYVDLLAGEGYEVDTAEDGQAGLEKAVEGGYDLILLDIVLPKRDGLEILQYLKEKGSEKPNGPIVLLTVLDQDSTIYTGLKSGAAGYLIKSDLNPDQVVKEVKRFLEQK
jgi:DNA-binding response OmpR family regulator